MVEGRRERKRNDTRRALLTAAVRLFAEQGIYGTSIEDITDAADLGKGTFYKHFTGRDEIVAAAVRHGYDALLERLQADVRGANDLRGVLAAVLSCHARFFHERPDFLLLTHQARGWLTLPAHEIAAVRDEFRRYTRELSGTIGQTAEGRQMSEAERDRMARYLAGIISGALSFEVIVGDGSAGVEDFIGGLRRLGAAL